MNYTIKALNPELADTFVKYLGELDFKHSPHWATCFCMYYYTNCSFEEWRDRTGDQNSAAALEQIRNGTMKGYLAFDGDQCIGWCNANDMNRFLRIKEELNPIVKDKKTGCVICFVIHPQYRGQGVARLLLKKAVEDFKEQGFDAVISVPFENTENPQKQYRGTKNMYRELGFQEVEKDGDASVMLLNL